MENGVRNGMEYRGKEWYEKRGRKCMKNRGSKCIRNGVSNRRVGLALLDTLTTQFGGQKIGGKLNPKRGKILVQKQGKFSYQHMMIPSSAGQWALALEKLLHMAQIWHQ